MRIPGSRGVRDDEELGEEVTKRQARSTAVQWAVASICCILPIWITTTAVGQEPALDSEEIELPEEPVDEKLLSPHVASPMDIGVFYDPRVDYDEGVFDAEEEVRKGEETIWVLSYEEKPPAKDPDTGLSIKYIVVDPNEPWHEKCMRERIRGHNMHILLTLAKKNGADASEEGQAEKKSVTEDDNETVDQE